MTELTDDIHLAASLELEAVDPDTPAERLDLLAAERALQPLVATNPATPAAALKRLRRTTNRTIRAAVASNPNSPIELLFELAGEFPIEVVENPGLEWLMVAQPELPGRMARELPPDTLCALFRSERLQESLLRALAMSPHDTLRVLATMHVTNVGEPGPDEPSPQALARGQAAFRAALRQTPFGEPEVVCDLPGMLAPWFIELLLDTPHAALISRSPDSSAALLVRLSWSGSPHVLLIVAAHPNTPMKLLAQLALHTSPDVRCAVAGNPATPTRVLSDLADTRHDHIRLAVAQHLAAGPATLAELARDHNPRIRAAVARNPSAPILLVRQLAAAAEPEVRGAAQRHLPMSSELLAYLAEDRNPLRRRAVAGHPDTAAKTLTRLCGDHDIQVRVNVARHVRASVDMLAQLCRDPEPAVRAAVAEHPRLPPHLRRRLELDGDPDVRAHLARNPHAPFTTLKRLWRDADREAGTDAYKAQLRVIAGHPIVTPERRGQLYARLFAGQLRQMRAAPTMVRLAALASDVLPDAGYEAGGGSRHWLDRYVVASNPASPLAVVEALARDGIIHVRAAARATCAARASRDAAIAPGASGAEEHA